MPLQKPRELFLKEITEKRAQESCVEKYEAKLCFALFCVNCVSPFMLASFTKSLHLFPIF